METNNKGGCTCNKNLTRPNSNLKILSNTFVESISIKRPVLFENKFCKIMKISIFMVNTKNGHRMEMLLKILINKEIIANTSIRSRLF